MEGKKDAPDILTLITALTIQNRVASAYSKSLPYS